MPKSEKIRVMISSRCKATIPYKGKAEPLSKVRAVLKDDIEKLTLWPGQATLCDCWINEPSPGASLTDSWWETSKREARRADIVIVLYNGESGGAIKTQPMGICHAELDAALATQSHKVRGIRLPMASLPTNTLERACDEAFREYVDALDMFAQSAETGEELIEKVRNEVRQATVDLVQEASVTPDLAKSNTGPALDWRRMSYIQRADAMRAAVVETLQDLGGTEPENLKPGDNEWMTYWLTIGGKRLLTPLHAVPASLAQSAAREIVGQPFLLDHQLHDTLSDGDGGPMHIVACYKGATESQALKMLGFPDATVVPGKFGLHVADSVQKIQFVLLRNCESPTSTRTALTGWLTWLQASHEDREVAKRATARKKIIAAIAKVNETA